MSPFVMTAQESPVVDAVDEIIPLTPGEFYAELHQTKIPVRLRKTPSTKLSSANTKKNIVEALEIVLDDSSYKHSKELVELLYRSADDAATAARQISGASPIVTTEGDLLAAQFEASIPMLIPGPQPRRMSSTRPNSPRWPDPALHEGLPCYTFDSYAQFKKVAIDGVSRTMEDLTTRQRASEVLTTGVRQPLSTHPALIIFTDGTPTQHALLVRDGITRWTACMLLILGLADDARKSDFERATEIIEALLPAPDATLDTFEFRTRQLAARKKFSGELQSERIEGDISNGTPFTQRGIHLNQSLVAPIKVYLPTEVQNQIIGAIDRMVADIHTGQQKWLDDDQDYKRAQDIIHAMHRGGHLTDTQLDLVLSVDDTQHPLHRACSIIQLLLRDKYAILKSEIRRQVGYSKVHTRHALKILAPVISRPWAGTKPLNSAWAQNGVLDSNFTNFSGFQLTNPEKYTELVQLALDGDESARIELRLAGAVALIANNKVSTTLLGGSGAAKSRTKLMRFENFFNGLTSSEEGLVQLALAADYFDASKSPKDDILRSVDLDSEELFAADSNGVPLGITQGGVQLGYLVEMAERGNSTILVTPADDDPLEEIDEVATAKNLMEQSFRQLGEQAAILLDLAKSVSTNRTKAELDSHDIVGQTSWQELRNVLTDVSDEVAGFKPRPVKP